MLRTIGDISFRLPHRPMFLLLMPASFFLNYKAPAMERINFPRNSKCASHRTPYWSQFSFLSLCEFQGSNSVPEAWQRAPNHLIGPILTNSKLYSEFCLETYRRPLTIFFLGVMRMIKLTDATLSWASEMFPSVTRKSTWELGISRLCLISGHLIWMSVFLVMYYQLRDTERCC